MPSKPLSDVCKVCGEKRDGKPGLFCAECRKEHNKLSMRLLRKGFTEEKISEIKTQQKEHKRELYKQNPKKYADRAKIKRDSDPGFAFYYNRVNKYNITMVGYLALLHFQNYKCGNILCGRVDSGGKGDWHIDHDHTSNKVCGLLCHYCNTAIGALRHCPLIISGALDYVKLTRSN